MDLVNEPIPRSDETVEHFAAFVEERERKSRRLMYIMFIVYGVVLATLCALPIDPLFAFGFGFAGAVVPVIYFFLIVVGGAFGHSRRLVRDGVAIKATVTDRLSKGSLFWQVEWTDASNKLRSVQVDNEKGMPRPGPEGIVLIVEDLRVFGVVLADRLYVLGRGVILNRV